jgi:ribonucleoside-diphosphate reductase alpha chain
MRGADAFAGTIKSGGKTRRAAKMVMLDVDHPDIEEFIRAKAVEEKKACGAARRRLRHGFDGGAYDSVQYQNANHSVRVERRVHARGRGGTASGRPGGAPTARPIETHRPAT